MSKTTGHGSAIITALEKAWAEIRKNHPEVPEALLITGTGAKGRSQVWGHWWAERWVAETATAEEAAEAKKAKAAAPKLPEVFVAGERMAQGAENVLETLLHEAAHGLAYARKVKDTSGSGYHNRAFVAHAEELGLEYAGGDRPHPTIGWSATKLSEGTAEKYAKTLKVLEAAIQAHLPQGGTRTKKTTVDRNLKAATCGCGRKLRASRTVLEEAPVICGLCMTPFEAKD